MVYDTIFNMGLLKGKEAAGELARLDITVNKLGKSEAEFNNEKSKLIEDFSIDDCHNGFEVAYRLGYNRGFTYENYETVIKGY